MKKAEQRLSEEVDRVAHYLDPATELKIREVAERELIARHMRSLAEMEHSGIIAMIEDNKIEDLRRCYELYKRVTQPTPGLQVRQEPTLRRISLSLSLSHTHTHTRRSLSSHLSLSPSLSPVLRQVIREIMAAHVKSRGTQLVQDEQSNSDPVQYVQGLLALRDKYEAVISSAFSGDKQFYNALNQSFESFVNLNTHSPEYISLFVDEQVRNLP